MSARKPLLHLDLFAGCGGLSLGMENAGFLPIFVNELNDDARATYITNRTKLNPLLGDSRFHSSDVREMAQRPYLRSLQRRLRGEFGIGQDELDLITGGPPCQGFSGIGHRRSYGVDKADLPSNHLFQDMATVIATLRPKAFLFENVRGLLNSKWTSGGRKGEVWELVRDTFRNLEGYRVRSSLVYAKDYGVSQNRPRILLIGFREDIDSSLLRDDGTDDAVSNNYLPARQGTPPPSLSELLGDLIDEDGYENGGATTFYPRDPAPGVQTSLRTLRGSRKVMKMGDAVTEQKYTKHSIRVLEKFKGMRDSGGAVPAAFKTKKFAQRLLPPTWGPGGPSITATSLPDDYVHFAQPRILTVREWARLQMFPDWYQFCGKRSTGGIRRAGNPREGVFDRELPKYTQIGNAVPVALAQSVGAHIAKVIRGR